MSFVNAFASDLQLSFDRHGAFYLDLNNGKLSAAFTTDEGPQTWKFGPNTKVVVDILDKPPTGYVFKDWEIPTVTVKPHHVQVRLFADKQTGDLHLWAVPDAPVNQLTKDELLYIYLYGPGQVIGRLDQHNPGFSQKLSIYVSLLTQSQYPPFFDFGPPQ